MNSGDIRPGDKAKCGAQDGKCNCGAGIERREFLKVAGVGFVSTTFGGKLTAAMAGPFSAADTASGHLIPADKKLSAEWLRGLSIKGAKEVFSGASLENIGMPCGGIGTGQLYLCGDGTLGCWQILNDAQSNWVEGTFATYKHRGVAKPVDQGFAVTIDSGDGPPTVKTLDREGFQEVSFCGQYPIGTVRYGDPDGPVRVEMEAFSPFIPLNAQDSALPATLFHITVENTGKTKLRVGALGWLQNGVCGAYARQFDAVRKTEYVSRDGLDVCVHSCGEPLPPPEPPKAPDARPPILFEDFEGTDFGKWTVEGDAFGKAPMREPLSGGQPATGFEGKSFACSSGGGDGPQGSITSAPFTITRRHINFLLAGGFHADKTCISLKVGGQTVRSSVGRNTAEMVWRSWPVSAWEGREAQLVISDKMSFPWGRIAVDQIEFSDTPRGDGPDPVTAAPDFGTMALACFDPASRAALPPELLPPGRTLEEFVTGETAAYSTLDTRRGLVRAAVADLAPGEKHGFTFALAWHFPNQMVGDKFDPAGWKGGPQRVGREYAVRFGDALAVAEYVARHHDRLTADTRLWRDSYYEGTLPCWLLDRLHSTVSCLATGTCQWWENGRFWAYEGVSCCHGTCSHVWNYAHAHARLFPELARSVCEMQDFNPREKGGGFHPETGLVGFRSDDGYAADGQCGTVLKAYREHLMSVDDAFLKRNWPHIRKALEFAISHDKNEDGLIEDLQHNTYDINYFGANTFVGALYLAALRAAEEMAGEVGDTDFARRVRAIFEKGRRHTDKRLWNGEYYVQEVDIVKHPKDQYGEGCLSDQLFGQSWAHQVGLGYLYPPEKVKSALQAVWKYNWAPDIGPYNEAHKPFRWFITPGQAGLITCTWPKGDYLENGTMYREEVWSGIEYQVAGHLIQEGSLTEGLAVCRAVHDRYHPDKFNPYNEVECGDHYARAMASWGVYLALAGFEYHGPKGHLAFAPRISPEGFQSLVTTAAAWAVLRQERSASEQVNSVEIRKGELRLNRLALQAAGNPKAVEAFLGDAPCASVFHADQERLTVEFPQGLHLKTGDTLAVRTRC